MVPVHLEADIFFFMEGSGPPFSINVTNDNNMEITIGAAPVANNPKRNSTRRKGSRYWLN